MRLFEINDPNRFFTLVVRDEIFDLLGLLKKRSEWKIYNKKLLHTFLKIHFEYHDQKYDAFIDDYFLKLSREEQEAINYEVCKTYAICEKNLYKIGMEKLRQELKNHAKIADMEKGDRI
jgi:hypothetical protein